MNKSCIGCGAQFQTENNIKEGFIKKENYEKSDICERCFKIKNYGEYLTILKDNSDFISILENINKTNDLVVLLVDLFQIPKDIKKITKHINNNILLVFTKRDLLPKSLKDFKLKQYQEQLIEKVVNTLIISSTKNYEIDLLMTKINKYKNSNRVYIVGFTNAGKSTLINKLLYNYSNNKTEITTSNLPSTTIDTIEVKLSENLTLIDTPGIIDEGNIINYIDKNDLKKIVPKKEIKPVTYQIKKNQTIIIDKYARIQLENNNITLYLSNNLFIDRLFKTVDGENLESRTINVRENEEVVISGLGFFKVTNPTKLKVLVSKDVDVYTRYNLI
ncbi:MAG: GTPase [Bacilli bacterium]